MLLQVPCWLTLLKNNSNILLWSFVQLRSQQEGSSSLSAFRQTSHRNGNNRKQHLWLCFKCVLLFDAFFVFDFKIKNGNKLWFTIPIFISPRAPLAFCSVLQDVHFSLIRDAHMASTRLFWTLKIETGGLRLICCGTLLFSTCYVLGYQDSLGQQMSKRKCFFLLSLRSLILMNKPYTFMIV